MMKPYRVAQFLVALWLFSLQGVVAQQPVSAVPGPEASTPATGTTSLKVGDIAPDFTLPDTDNGKVTLSQFKGRKNVVLSFVPAAWTPVCSQQWPGYNIAKELFEQNDAVLIGVSVDNVPTLAAWTGQMGKLWFTVASDFWPHGETAKKYGVLRPDGMSERALFVIDKSGVIRYVDVHDINLLPRLEILIKELGALKK